MDSDIKNVSLSFCCKEDWRKFATIDEQTRFCSTCKHNVIDFTNARQEALKEALQSGQRVCGKFKVSQMNESFLKLAAASLVIAVSAGAVNCTPEKIEAEPPISQSITSDVEIEIMGDTILTGIVFEEADTTAVKLDSLDVNK